MAVGDREHRGPLLGIEAQRVAQQPHGVQLRVGALTGLQPANGPHRQASTIRQILLRQGGPLPQLPKQHTELARHTTHHMQHGRSP
jgi:hypothetical protein